MADACALVDVPVARSTARVGDVTLAFGQPDDARHPKAWLGPLKISVGSAPACTVSDDVSIIEMPVMLGGNTVYVSSYSGSTNRLYAVNVKSCRVIWRSRDFRGTTRFQDAMLTFGGQHLRLNQDCHPAQNAGVQ